MPPDKAPVPDGFNGTFLKKCWHITKEDIYDLCFDFFNDRVNIHPINNAFITLVTKVNTPTISLLNCITKIITKLMGSKFFQLIIIPLVHLNQYGFIKTRTIQDCLA
jgi:hypothetical protein